MKKINWKVRFQNKTWLVSFLTVVVAFCYQVLGLFDVMPSVSQDMTMQLVMIGANVLAALGVVIDPTTAGAADSRQALEYNKPKKEE